MDIWIHENDNLLLKLRDIENSYSVNLQQLMQIAGAKSTNSKVGIFSFHSKDTIFNIIIHPKTIEPNYLALSTYFRSIFQLLAKYPKQAREYEIDQALLNLALQDLNGTNIDPHSVLIAYYKKILDEILHFFNFHESVSSKKINVQSPSLDFQLDIYNTITCFDRSTIPQIKIEKINRSYIAALSLSVLNFFKRKNKHLLDSSITRSLNHIISFIKKKYNLNKSGTALNILTRKSRKYFRANNEVALYNNLILLLGIDNSLVGETKAKDIKKQAAGISLFFQPEIFYELRVYDFLIEHYGSDSIELKPNNLYKLKNIESNQVYRLRAEPDFIIKTENETYVMDAKWKSSPTLKSSFVYDYLKLYRDSKVYGANKMYLAYPLLDQQLSDGDKFVLEAVSDLPVSIKLIPM